MKSFTITFISLFIISAMFSQSLATIGMTMDEVNKIYPDMEKSTYENTTTLSRPENLYGLDGTWGYRFENDKLTWIYFNKYIDDINNQNFKKCLSATKQLLKAYTKKYGKPETTTIGNPKFVDPYKKIHWGYNVIQARWADYEGMKIKLEFNFMGGKGDYHFLVKTNYFDKSYPYYD